MTFCVKESLLTVSVQFGNNETHYRKLLYSLLLSCSFFHFKNFLSFLKIEFSAARYSGNEKETEKELVGK